MDFQTPSEVCDYMVSLMKSDNLKNHLKILEPTPGEGNLVNALRRLTFNEVIAPDDFWNIDETEYFDYIIMNPPFSPMEMGYKILYRCMNMSNRIIALMPWLTIINSEKRTKDIMNFGLRSITHLPRNVFKGSRVQCCVLEMEKDFREETKFKTFNFKNE